MPRAARLPRRLPITLAAVLVATAASVSSGVGAGRTGRDARTEPATTLVGTGVASAIVPGSVDRTSVNLTRLVRGRAGAALRRPGPSRSTRPRRSRTPRAARSTGSSSTRSPPASAAWSCARSRSTASRRPRRSATRPSIVPLGGILPAGATAKVRVQYRSTLRSSLSGSNWLFTKVNGIVDAYRWIPWVSRETPFDRPNHGDPFVTPVSPFGASVEVETDRQLGHRLDRRTASRSRSNGLTQRFEASNVRDVTITAAPDFRSRSVLVGAVRVRYYYRSAANAAAILDAAADAVRGLPVARRAVPVPDLQGRPVEPAATGWSRRASSGSRTGSAARTCATSSRTRRPTSGSTASSATTRPASRSPTRRRPTSSPARSRDTRRSSRCSTGTARPDDLRLLERLLLRDRLHPGRQPARTQARGDGLDGVLGGAAQVRRRSSLSA